MNTEPRENDGPEYSVSCYLGDGIELAKMHELEALDEKTRETLEMVAKLIVLGKDQLAIRAQSAEAVILSLDDDLLGDN